MPSAHSSTPPPPASISPAHHTRPHQTADPANCPAPPPKKSAQWSHWPTSTSVSTAHTGAAPRRGALTAHQMNPQPSPIAPRHRSAPQSQFANNGVSPVQTIQVPALSPIRRLHGFCPHRDHPTQASCEIQFRAAAVVASASPSKATGCSVPTLRASSKSPTGVCRAHAPLSLPIFSASC
jgi:hypothetical protein